MVVNLNSESIDAAIRKLEEYERSEASREVVRTRIKSEKLSQAISKIGKVIAVKDGDSYIVIN